MSRTTIQQFRASLAGDADQTTLMRAYRAIARRPAPVGGSVGVEWTTWPPAAAAAGDWGPWAAEARATGDWLQWTREAGKPIPLGTSPLTAGWVQWPDGQAASEREPRTRLAGWGDWSTPPAAHA
jgi:hypothetical protein